MSKNVADLTTEEAAIAAKVEAQRAASEKAASVLVGLFDESASTFRKAKVIATSLDKGATTELIGQHLSAMRAEAQAERFRNRGVEVSPEDIERWASTKPSKGGVEVPKSTIAAYYGAWQSVTRAGLKPEEDTVNLAFRLLSTGGTASARTALEKRVFASVSPEGDEPPVSVEVAAEAYVTGAREILAGRVQSERKPRNQGGTGGGSKESLELPEGAVGMSLEVALHNLAIIVGQAWDESQRAELAAALAGHLEALSEAPVEV